MLTFSQFRCSIFRLPAKMNDTSFDVSSALTNTLHSDEPRRTMIQNGIFNNKQTLTRQSEDELTHKGATLPRFLSKGISFDESLLSQTTHSKAKGPERSTMMSMLFGAPLMVPVMIGLSEEVQETERRAKKVAVKTQQGDDSSVHELSKTPNAEGNESAGRYVRSLVYQRGASPLVVEVRGRHMHRSNAQRRCRDPYRHVASDSPRSRSTSRVSNILVSSLSKAGNPALCSNETTATKNLQESDDAQNSSCPSVNLKSNLKRVNLIAKTA